MIKRVLVVMAVCCVLVLHAQAQAPTVQQQQQQQQQRQPQQQQQQSTPADPETAALDAITAREVAQAEREGNPPFDLGDGKTVGAATSDEQALLRQFKEDDPERQLVEESDKRSADEIRHAHQMAVHNLIFEQRKIDADKAQIQQQRAELNLERRKIQRDYDEMQANEQRFKRQAAATASAIGSNWYASQVNVNKANENIAEQLKSLSQRTNDLNDRQESILSQQQTIARRASEEQMTKTMEIMNNSKNSTGSGDEDDLLQAFAPKRRANPLARDLSTAAARAKASPLGAKAPAWAKILYENRRAKMAASGPPKPRAKLGAGAKPAQNNRGSPPGPQGKVKPTGNRSWSKGRAGGKNNQKNKNNNRNNRNNRNNNNNNNNKPHRRR